MCEFVGTWRTASANCSGKPNLLWVRLFLCGAICIFIVMLNTHIMLSEGVTNLRKPFC